MGSEFDPNAHVVPDGEIRRQQGNFSRCQFGHVVNGSVATDSAPSSQADARQKIKLFAIHFVRFIETAELAETTRPASQKTPGNIKIIMPFEVIDTEPCSVGFERFEGHALCFTKYLKTNGTYGVVLSNP